MLDSDAAEASERRREREHPLAQIRMHAHPLQLGERQWPGLVPDCVRDAAPPEVIDARRSPQLSHVRFWQPEAPSSAGDQLFDGVDMTQRPRGLELGELADGFEREV